MLERGAVSIGIDGYGAICRDCHVEVAHIGIGGSEEATIVACCTGQNYLLYLSIPSPAKAGRIYIANGYGGTLFQRMAHTQAWEAVVIAIRRHPFAAAFDRQSSQKRIGDEITLDTAGSAELTEDFPMTRAWIDERAVRLITEFLGKRQRLLHAAGRIEHAGMRHDAKETA